MNRGDNTLDPTRARLVQAWRTEHAAAHACRASGDMAAEWRHLERAHILSQPMACHHVRTHVSMLGAGIRRRDLREIVGQVGRTVVAGPGTLTGRYPIGNTGGSNVSATAVMPIPADLKAVLDGHVVVRPSIDRTSATGRR
jgi:hypothetical protein